MYHIGEAKGYMISCIFAIYPRDGNRSDLAPSESDYHTRGVPLGCHLHVCIHDFLLQLALKTFVLGSVFF
jgi:hypothetical protein